MCDVALQTKIIDYLKTCYAPIKLSLEKYNY